MPQQKNTLLFFTSLTVCRGLLIIVLVVYVGIVLVNKRKLFDNSCAKFHVKDTFHLTVNKLELVTASAAEANPQPTTVQSQCPACEKIVNNFNLYGSKARESFVNLHRYGYVIDNSLCEHDTPDVLIVVHSKIDHFTKRDRIRSTWAINRSINGVTFRTAFFLGLPHLASNESSVQSHHHYTQVLTEVRHHNDIVMGNFTDSYRNLTKKLVMTLGWSLSHCPNMKYLIKVDDDVIVNVYNVAGHVTKTFRDQKEAIVCRVQKSSHAHRHHQSKWYVSNREYPFKVYPPYCMGYGIFMTREIARKLYEATSDIRPFWIDDVYLTGIVAWSADVSLTPFFGNLTVTRENFYSPHHQNAMFIKYRFSSERTFQQYWQNLTSCYSHLFQQYTIHRKSLL